MARSRTREAETELRLWLLLLLLVWAATLQGCTLVKPVVGVFTGPFMIVGESGRGSGGDCRALLIFGAIGAAAGLVTGIISDANTLLGTADDPARNWYDPFRTNRSATR